MWCEALESNVHLSEDAYKAHVDSACPFLEKGLGIEIFCFRMDSLNDSSFIQHLDSSFPSMLQKMYNLD